MNSKEIVISKRAGYAISLVLVILVALLVFGGKFSILGFGNTGNVDSSKLVAGSPEKFDVLSSHGTQGNVGST
jgi:hypothetical protein